MELLASAFKNLGRKRGRTILTVLGIAIGVASVILIGNISQCGSAALTNELDSLGLSGLSISVSPETGNVALTEENLSLVKESSQVDQAMPVMVQSTELKTTRTSSNALLWGIDSDANKIISIQILYGRSINSKDVKSRANVCMVDENFAKSAYSRSNIVGKTITVTCAGTQENFSVIGIVKTGSGLLQNMMGDYIPTFVYIPYTTMQNAIGKDSFDQIAVKVKSGVNVEQAGDNLIKTLSRSIGISNGFLANNLVKQKDTLTNMLDIITLILSAIGAISLLVASLSIMTVMLVSVNERTREIGIKKSVGAKRSYILFEFLFEALLISIIGCLVGLTIGYGISFLGAYTLGIFLSARFDIALTAIFFAIGSSIIFGVYPAAKASKLKPVDALRME